MKVKLEEAKRIEDSLVEQLMETSKEKENLEAEIVSLKTKLQKKYLDKSYESQLQ